MGDDCGTWIPELHNFNWQSPNLSSFDDAAAAPFGTGKQNGSSAAMMNRGANTAMPAYVPSALPHSQLGHSGEPHGWFYCLPRFRQGFTTPARNFEAEEKPAAGHTKGFTEEEVVPNGEPGFPQKQFLVIDQTGNQTTLVYSSRFGGGPVECLASWDPKLQGSNNNLNNGNELLSLRRDVNHVVGLGPTLDDDKVDENQGTDDDEDDDDIDGYSSEMHENTEEINALLYSDSDGYSTEDGDGDEVTSTGHSPSTMTTHDNHEEPASSVGETKKRKLWDDDGAYDDNDMQFMDTASSLNGKKRPFEAGDDDDAESRCSSGGGGGKGSSIGSGNKKMRKEKIQDVLSILQCIVPGGKGKDPIELLDEAIRCLKSLKLKAIELGLDATT